MATLAMCSLTDRGRLAYVTASTVQPSNSLKIKHLLRISEKENVAGELQAIFSEGNFISTNEQNAIFNFTNTEPNNFRLAQLRIGDFNNFVLSETMEDIMISERNVLKFRPSKMILDYINKQNDT